MNKQLNTEAENLAKPLLSDVQTSLFDFLCVRCRIYDKEYDCFCDGCASEHEYQWAIFLQEIGYKDYSEAVRKEGRKSINSKFDLSGKFSMHI